MLIVAIRALHQPLVHTMAEWPGEILPDFGVAGVAKQRLFLHHQELGLLGMVRRMARYATHIVNIVLRPSEVCVLFPVFVALHAARADLLGCGRLEAEDLALVASPRNVLRSRPMAAFATLPFRMLGVQGGLPMRSALEGLEHILMATLTGI